MRIKCKVYDSILYYSFNIKIYDFYNTLLFETNILNNEWFYYNKENGINKIIITNDKLYPYRLCYVLNNQEEIIIPYYKNYINPNLHYINFFLTDYYYDGLPIRKGEIRLWQ